MPSLGPDASGELDFVERIAAPFPLGVIAWVLGVPNDDWELLFRWTNEVIGKDDPEYRRPGESPGATSKRARGELHAYFQHLIEQRRAEPEDDLVSELIRRGDRRRAADRGAARLVLRAPRGGGQRDHPQRDQRRAARVLRAPGRVEAAARPTRAPARRGRGDPAVGEPDQPLHPHRHRGLRGARRARSAPATRSRCTSRRRTATRRCSKIRSRSASIGVRTRISRSASASTSAWARTSHASSSRRSSATCSTRLESFEVVGTVERLRSIVNGSIKRLPLGYSTR